MFPYISQQPNHHGAPPETDSPSFQLQYPSLPASPCRCSNTLTWFNYSFLFKSAVGRRTSMGKIFGSVILIRTGSVSSLFMGYCKVLHVWLGYAAFLALFGVVSVLGHGDLRITFKETPLNSSSKSNTTFRFDALEENGFNPCLDQQCSIQCKLDDSVFQDCSSREASFQNLAEGKHVFSVYVQVRNGSLASSEFSWIVDTIPPTAVLDGGQAFTNKGNVTMNIAFSEKCENSGGFLCTNTSSCELLVYGAATVIPSTIEEIEKGRVYTIVVQLSSDVSSGRVVVALARSACSDAAGNFFQRTKNSTSVIHFDRTIPSVNMWTALPDFDIAVGSGHKTIQVTNKISDLRIYLDFNEPITATAEELLALLNVSNGVLTATHRNTAANRRFGYVLRNVEEVSVVTISLPGNVVASRYGTLVPKSSSTTFLYDTERPQVHLRTSYPAKSKNHIVPIEVHFTEAVFGFNSSGVTVSGGTLTSFREISKSTYTLELYVVANNLLLVRVPESQCMDVAGNINLASPTLQVRHYSTPAVSVVLYYLITAGLLSTAFVSGALTISSAILAAAGALSTRETGSVGIDPSRNLLGMACHLQIYALSDWLSVSLPIEYREVTSGLQWLIPHVKTPWQHDRPTKSELEHKVMTSIPSIVENSIRGRRRLFGLGHMCESKFDHRGRVLGANTTIYGPAFGRDDYEFYFLNPSSGLSMTKGTKYLGWQDFQRNMFWIGVVAGALVLLHVLILRFVRWRTKRSLRGALTIPRPEIFILILAVPGLCQASAFIIRGGSVVGIAIGVFLLLIPVAFLLTVTILVIHGICFRALVQYKEFRSRVNQSNDSSQLQRHRSKVVAILTGTGFPGVWVRRGRLALSFLPRYGLLFEDRKGPPKMIAVDTERKIANSKFGNTVDSVDTDDDSDEVEVSCFHRIVGCARAAYILVDLSRRITLGLVFGAYPRSNHSWSQVALVFGINLIQFAYLVLVRPFRSRGVQLVETTSLLCEVGVFSVALALLVIGDPTENHFAAGVLMLVLMLTSFVAELVNEWYAIMKQLLSLSTSTVEPSLQEGLKMLSGGFIILFIPRSLWSRFVNFPPPPPPDSVPAHSSSNPIQERNSSRGILERQRQDSEAHIGSPFGTPKAPESLIPLYLPGSPAFIDPRSSTQSAKSRDEDSGPPSGELRPEGALKTWNSKRPMEGKKSKGASKDSKTEELRMLRELAKASFTRRRRDIDEYGMEQGVGSGRGGIGTPAGSGRGGMGTPVDVFSPAESPQRRDHKRYTRRRKQFPGMSTEGYTDDSISEATSDADTLHDDPPALPDISTFVNSTALVSSSSTSTKPGSGHSESLSPFRELSLAIRPLEER